MNISISTTLVLDGFVKIYQLVFWSKDPELANNNLPPNGHHFDIASKCVSKVMHCAITQGVKPFLVMF